MLTYHFISPSNPVNPEISLILGCKDKRNIWYHQIFLRFFSVFFKKCKIQNIWWFWWQHVPDSSILFFCAISPLALNLTSQWVVKGKWKLEIFKRITKINVLQWSLQSLQKQMILILWKIENGILVYHFDMVAIVSNKEHLFLLSKISGIGEIPSMLRNIWILWYCRYHEVIMYAVTNS